MRSLRRASESSENAQSVINLNTWKEAPGCVDSTSRRPSGNCECQAAGLARLAHKVGFICFKSRVSRASSILRWRRGRLDRLVGVHGETGRTACQLGRFLIRLPRCLCSVSQMEASILMECASGDQISTFGVSRVCSALQTTALVVPAS